MNTCFIRPDVFCLKRWLSGKPGIAVLLAGVLGLFLKSGHAAETAPSTKPAASIVFIDGGIVESAAIARTVLPGQTVVILDPDRDELTQISHELVRARALGGHWEKLHLVSHGSPGTIRLGSQIISRETLQRRAPELAAWRNDFGPSTEILLYGCETGAGAPGLAFLQEWADLTGAKVAASSNLTGAKHLGGDWALEISTAPVKSAIAFDSSAVESLPITLSDNLFYHDGSAGRLYRADLDGSNTNILLSYNGTFQVSSIDSVVVDPVHTNLYYNRIFNDANRGLYKTTYTGASPTRISPHSTNLVSGISIDLANSKIYLHDDTAGKWYQMNLDGSGATVLQSIAATGAFSAVDYKNSAFYYTQTISGSTRGLYKTDLAMTTTGTLITTAGNQISGVAVDMNNDKIYYHDFTGLAIYQANLDGSSAVSKLTVTANYAAIGITIDHANSRVYYSVAAGSANSSLRGIYRTADMNLASPTKISLNGTDQISPVGITTYYAPPSAPSVTTSAAASITVTGATLNGVINPNGFSTTAAFEYGSDTTYGSVAAITLSPDNSSTNQNVSAAITGLLPNTTYHFRAAATNSVGSTYGSDLTFATAQDSSAPTAINLSNNTVAENQAAGTAVGTLSATDPDAGDTAAFTLVSGVGSTDNAAFAITGNTLQTAASFDYETKNAYSIRVRVSDSGGLTFEDVFIVNVLNVNEPPSFSGYSLTVAKDTVASVLTAKLLAKTSDPEGDARMVSSVGATSSQGGSVTLAGSFIQYTPPAGYTGSDSFSVIFSDGLLTTTGIVTVNVGVASGNGPTLVSITTAGSDVQLKFAGIPSAQYDIQRSTSLSSPVDWTTLSTRTADGSGFFTYTDSNPPSPSYWRSLVTTP